MNTLKVFFLLIFFMFNISFAQTKEVDTLLEKVNQETNINQRKELLEDLKIKLAKANKKAREEADAIIKERQKIPLSKYDDSSLRK